MIRNHSLPLPGPVAAVKRLKLSAPRKLIPLPAVWSVVLLAAPAAILRKFGRSGQGIEVDAAAAQNIAVVDPLPVHDIASSGKQATCPNH